MDERTVELAPGRWRRLVCRSEVMVRAPLLRVPPWLPDTRTVPQLVSAFDVRPWVAPR